MTIRLMTNSSGNLWLDRQAWFALAINGQTPADMCLTQADLNALKEIYSKPYFEEKRYLAAIKAARAEMEAQSAVFVQAFLRLIDVIDLIRMSESPLRYYKPYPRTNSIREFQMDQLFRLFPIQANDQIEVVIFAGEEVCPDWRFGSNPGAGSMVSEVGLEQMGVGIKSWWKYPQYGFEEGLSFVRVADHEPIYRFAQSDILQLWSEASQNVRPRKGIKGRTFIDQKDVEPFTYQALPALFQRIYGVNPGDPIKP